MMGKGKCAGHMIAAILVIIGGLNWGLVGAFNYNLVDSLLGAGSMLSRIIYVLVGLAALLMIVGCKCKKCKAGACKGCGMGDKMGEKKMEGGSEMAS